MSTKFPVGSVVEHAGRAVKGYECFGIVVESLAVFVRGYRWVRWVAVYEVRPPRCWLGCSSIHYLRRVERKRAQALLLAFADVLEK